MFSWIAAERRYNYTVSLRQQFCHFSPVTHMTCTIFVHFDLVGGWVWYVVAYALAKDLFFSSQYVQDSAH